MVPEHLLPSQESCDNHASTGSPSSDKADATQRHTDRVPESSQACLVPGFRAQDHWATQLASQGESSFGDPKGTSPTSTLMLDFCLQNRRREHASVALSPSVYGSLFWWPHLHGHLVREGLRSLRDTTMESGRNLRGILGPVSTTWARCRKAA